MEKRIKIRKGYQIFIPKGFLNKLKINPGDFMQVSYYRGFMFLKKL